MRVMRVVDRLDLFYTAVGATRRPFRFAARPRRLRVSSFRGLLRSTTATIRKTWVKAEEDPMLNLDEMTRTMDAITPRRENSSLNTAQAAPTAQDRLATRDNTGVVSTMSFYPVYASPDDVDFQREELFEPQFLPR
jgi:hypothetical protein